MEAPDLHNLMGEELDPPKVEKADIKVKLNLEWGEDEAADVEYIKATIEDGIRKQYAQIYEEEHRLLRKVRVKNPDGTFQQYADGSYVEHWDNLTIQDLERFVNAGSSEVLFAQQRVDDAYADAVFAKFTYDDSYDKAYSSQLTGTIGDKTARAKRHTQDERWRALYRSLYHKRAQDLVNKFEAHVRRAENIYRERQNEARRVVMATKGVG